MDGDLTVAKAVQDSMTESGERVRIKEWLIESLESCGWASSVDRMVAQYCSDKADSSLSVAQIAEQLTSKAFECVPEDVRNQLLKELLAVVVAFNDAVDDNNNAAGSGVDSNGTTQN